MLFHIIKQWISLLESFCRPQVTFASTTKARLTLIKARVSSWACAGRVKPCFSVSPVNRAIQWRLFRSAGSQAPLQTYCISICISAESFARWSLRSPEAVQASSSFPGLFISHWRTHVEWSVFLERFSLILTFLRKSGGKDPWSLYLTLISAIVFHNSVLLSLYHYDL